MSASPFTGTGRLVRLALRRDRIQLPIWLVVVAGLPAASARNLPVTYPDEASRVAAVKTITSSPGLLMLRGPAPGTDYGALTTAQTFSFVAILAALMSTLAVVRHTRQNEEAGRTEILGSGVVGRHAQLAAALTVVVAANAVLCLLVTAFAVGGKLDATGAFTLGLATAGVGIVFAGIAAVTAQVFEAARTANGAAAAIIGAAYLLRGIANAVGTVSPDGLTVDSSWVTWLSPIGWGEQMKPFGDNNAALFLLFPVFAAILIGAAFALTSRRDVGQGMLPQRPGPPVAPASLLSPEGLAWRLQRGVLLAWSVAAVVVGAAVGSVGKQIQETLETNPDLRDTIARLGGGGGDPVNVFFAAMLGIIGAIAAGYAVQALLRTRSEETGPLESLLATSVSRPRWLVSHVLVAVGGTVVILLISGLAMGLTYGATVGDVGGQVGTLIGAALARVPASLVLAGFVVLVFGLVPRFTVAIGWGALGLCLLLGQLGELLKLPQAVRDISPFTHVPALPAADLDALPLVVLLVVAAALLAGGVVAFRRRSITS